MPIALRRLDTVDETAIVQLAEVLADCVAGGASVSFMHPFPVDRAAQFWRKVAAGVAAGERVLLVAADELGIDRIELRKRNIIQPEQMPYKAPLGQVYDSGKFAENQELGLKHADYAGFPARR